MMTLIGTVWSMFLLLWSVCPALIEIAQSAETALPPFGRDTVLVYVSSNEKEAPFVVRIAQFFPDRYVEWEDATTQGTVFMPAKAVIGARSFLNWQLYQGGMDTRGKNATTLWLSQRLFRELKKSPKIKFDMDGIPTWMESNGTDQMTIEVNRASRNVPVIKTKDERGAERWFLDMEENALLVNSIYRNYQQKLVTITTDRTNTLRWIKKK